MDAQTRARMGVLQIEERFGLSLRRHRIGGIDLAVAEVRSVDEMVAAVYPDAVIDHGDAPAAEAWSCTARPVIAG